MPQKKTFGIFGGKPAEVKVWVDVPEKKIYKEDLNEVRVNALFGMNLIRAF